MYLRYAFLVLLSLTLVAPTWAAGSGELVLKNASHGDKQVGSSPKDGISQGHDLKIVLQKVSFGKNMADGAGVSISIRHGGKEYKSLSGNLNDTGYTEILFTIPNDWAGIYQVDVSIAGNKKKTWKSTRPFRVIAAEPGSDVPEASSLALLAAALIAFALCWRPLVQRA